MADSTDRTSLLGDQRSGPGSPSYVNAFEERRQDPVAVRTINLTNKRMSVDINIKMCVCVSLTHSVTVLA